MSKQNYSSMAEEILNSIGGAENVSSVTHCMTRLRFVLKDASIPQDDKLKKISGVLGIVRAGGQYQIVIGPQVSKVYDAVLKAGNGKLTAEAPINENLDKDLSKEKLTWKKAGKNILDVLTGSMVPLIPVLMVSGMFKMLASVLGPDLLKVLTAQSDLYRVFNLVGDAALYFLPIMIGYTSAKKMHTSKILGMLMGAIMLDPMLLQIIKSKAPFTVYGIPMYKTNYTSTVIPIILTVWIMSYVYKSFKKYIPDTLEMVLTPTLTVLVMLPIELCIVGPLGNIIGNAVDSAIISFGKMGGLPAIIVITLIGALWELLVLTGMHLALMAPMLLIFAQGGHEAIISPGASAATVAIWGMAFGAFLRARNKENKATYFGFFISGILGGVTEPSLYGLAIAKKKPFIGAIAGGACGALYGAITHITANIMAGTSNFLNVITYTNSTTMNFINAVILEIIAFIVAAIVTYALGFDENK